MPDMKAPNIGNDSVIFCIGSNRFELKITGIKSVDPATGIWIVETSNPGMVVSPDGKHHSSHFDDFKPDVLQFSVKASKYLSREWEIATDVTPFS